MNIISSVNLNKTNKVQKFFLNFLLIFQGVPIFMLLGKKKKLGREIEQISVGEKLTLTEKMEDKELLLYLGLTNDANPLYIQHDFASMTSFKKPVVPNIMLTGIITSSISKYFPGPGSYITRQEIEFLQPVYHYETITFLFVVREVHTLEGLLKVEVCGENEAKELVVRAVITVKAPEKMNDTDTSN